MFKFEPGSYQTPAGFLPALACYKIDKNKNETFDYILTNTKIIELTEQKAVENAEKSLNKAFQKRQKTGDDFDLAQSLKTDGFVKIDDPKFAKDEPKDMLNPKIFGNKDTEMQNITTPNSKTQIGRNDNCPCGSGLKYKKCCINK